MSGGFEFSHSAGSRFFDFYVLGEIPPLLSGSLIVACSRRHKDRSIFARWHDSQADLVRIDLHPGKPGKVRARVLEVDPSGADVAQTFRRTAFDDMPAGPPVGRRHRYATQPNHGINIRNQTVWATNLLFGAPLEVDLVAWKPKRVLRYLDPSDVAPQASSTSHFAWSLNGRYAYFHQSLFERETPNSNVRAADLSLIELDTQTGSERLWKIVPPAEDCSLETANFHSAFYYEESGRRFVGLLRTGALLESLEPHSVPVEHRVQPMPRSTIWILELDPTRDALRARLLPGIEELDGLALSHLDVDASSGDGFVLFANYKQADVAEETHGLNIYGEQPEKVWEHYSGMIIEAINYGMVIRYERRKGGGSFRSFSRPYDPAQTSLGHSWLPINLQITSTKKHVFGSFSGFRPRLLPRHVAAAYQGKVVDAARIRYVPPLLMRFDAATLQPDYDRRRCHLSYAEPVALAAVGDGRNDYICTFSPEVGLRIYPADDLTRMVCHATTPYLMNWRDTHFRPDPAHMQFVPR